MFTDSHCHILTAEYQDIQPIIRNLEKDNIKRIIINGYNFATNLEVLKTISNYDNVYGALGVHPDNLKEGFNESLQLIEDNMNNSKLIAIGEIGLDFFHGDNKVEQIQGFEKLLTVAEKYHKPVIIHNRSATPEMLVTLKKFNVKGVIHCFSGSYETANEFIKLGFKLGINGIVTFKNSNLPNILAKIDLKNILLETDSPYITPEPYRKEINEPKYINEIALKVAQIYDISIEKLAAILEENFHEIFDI